MYGNYLITKRAAQFGFEKWTISAYAYNAVRALALDQALRQHTGGAKSLDDLLRLLIERFGKARQHFFLIDLIQAINEVAGADLTEFYNRYFLTTTLGEVPPVEDAIGGYRDSFLAAVDFFTSPAGHQPVCRGSRTMFLIALELGIFDTDRWPDEHWIMQGTEINNLDGFRAQLLALGHPPTEADVVSAISAITGVPEDDFFEFYTVGEYRPSLTEVQQWLLPAGPAPVPTPRADWDARYVATIGSNVGTTHASTRLLPVARSTRHCGTQGAAITYCWPQDPTPRI